MSCREIEPIRTLDSLSSQRNFFAEGRAVSPQELERAMARGRRLRSNAYLRLVTAIARGVLKLAKRSHAAYRRWREIRRSDQALRGLDAHLRRDIGIDGHQIPALARGLEDESVAARRGSVQVRRLPIREPGVVASDDCCVDRAA